MIGVQRFSASTDEEAVTIGHAMIKGASAVASFDLWEGDRPVHGAAPMMRARLRRRPKKKAFVGIQDEIDKSEVRQYALYGIHG